METKTLREQFRDETDKLMNFDNKRTMVYYIEWLEHKLITQPNNIEEECHVGGKPAMYASIIEDELKTKPPNTGEEVILRFLEYSAVMYGNSPADSNEALARVNRYFEDDTPNNTGELCNHHFVVISLYWQQCSHCGMMQPTGQTPPKTI